MIDGDSIVRGLETRRLAGASSAELIEDAVRRIEDAGDAYDWVGVYLLEGDELVLDAYVGKHTDHTRIPIGRGVCGTAVAEDRDINVPDVRELDNYLACSLETVSELVVLIRDPETREILGQLDLDSDRPAAFGEADERELGKIADWLGGVLERG